MSLSDTSAAISLAEIAEKIEDGLNAYMTDPDLRFKVWAGAGEMTKALRSGNNVTQWIPANLRSVSSSNDNNIIVMGANGLMLDVSIPIQRPMTNAEQTEEELEKVSDGQYRFPDEIKDIIDQYFQLYKVFTEEDDAGVSYTFSMEGGRVNDGVADILPGLDECLTVSVYISLTYLQGGINARNVGLLVDGVQLPFSSLQVGRSNRLASDVYNTGPVVKNLATATALSFDFTFPATADLPTQQAFAALLEGKPNIAHFVTLQIGSAYDGEYFMFFENLTLAAEGVAFAGITGALIEAAENPLLLDTPDYMQVGRFSFSSSQTSALTFTATPSGDEPVRAFIAGSVTEMNGAQSITLSPSDFVYDAEDDVYYVYLITSAALAVTAASATFSIVRGAS